MEALPRAKAAAIKALKLDNTLGEAHTSLAFLLDAFDWDVRRPSGIQASDRPQPRLRYGASLVRLALERAGKNNEAIAEMRRARRLDPLSLIINADFAELLLIAHHVEESIQQSRKTIEMDANFPLAHNQLGVAYLASHRPAAAITELQRAVQLSGGQRHVHGKPGGAWRIRRRSDAGHVLRI